MKLAGIRAVTFDAAGTLLAPYPSVGDIYAEVAAAAGFTAPAAELEQRFHATLAAAARRTRTDEAAEASFWRRLTGEVFAPFVAGEDMERLFPALWETFAEARRWRPRPGATTTFEILQGRGYRLAILSNWDARLHRVITGLGWRRWLPDVLLSSELGAEKPDRAIFDRAAASLGCAPGEILHVGDSPSHDAAGALAAGWHAALVGGAVADGALALRSLEDLADLL